jgi:hypothetical protein
MRQLGNLAWLLDDAGAMDKRPGPEPDDFRADLPALLAESPRAAPAARGRAGGSMG